MRRLASWASTPSAGAICRPACNAQGSPLSRPTGPFAEDAVEQTARARWARVDAQPRSPDQHRLQRLLIDLIKERTRHFDHVDLRRGENSCILVA